MFQADIESLRDFTGYTNWRTKYDMYVYIISESEYSFFLEGFRFIYTIIYLIKSCFNCISSSKIFPWKSNAGNVCCSNKTMFSGFKSQCTTFYFFKYLKQIKSCIAIFFITFSSNPYNKNKSKSKRRFKKYVWPFL